ncbi:CheR family methyltransferase [Novosphingobium mangrovi (ex Huang et al. 2023)]|uniref:Protein-glutamate O-methyltransferase CheR n=1 Tax=Novosphingobium mangrovi (ex Huang et al. 2023) TaxID=2976432 RepID=A0ABT2I489_9SPHN|nr:protein-glutamate O-methyltransferase CheR [Novosphingobium mangrovi (ex Huang et al. 2023)]MCT2399619.1 protein-glutamate O-methyltransferase CheR [Novosphingobium mangrovi (ex Huang et al. 2023)]
MQISETSKQILAELLKSQTGQDFPTNRIWRVGTALSGLSREHGIANLDRLIAKLALSHRSALAEALLNNETYFFRDRAMFELLDERVLPELARERASARSLRIWSVGCSTGQEVLSLAMLFAEQESRWAGWKVDILGTDVSSAAIEAARAACYTPFQIQRGLAVGQMVKWFEETPQGWRAQDKLRRMVRFERHNLLDPLPCQGGFDIVLCRNVLLYFDDATRKCAFERLSAAIAPDGWLMLGAGETSIGQTGRIVPDRTLRGLHRLSSFAAAQRQDEAPRRAAG